MSETQKVSDYAVPTNGESRDLMKIEDILGWTLLITSFKHQEGDYGNFITILAETDSKKLIINTGSKVVAEILEGIEANLPLFGTFDKVKGKSGFYYYIIK